MVEHDLSHELSMHVYIHACLCMYTCVANVHENLKDTTTRPAYVTLSDIAQRNGITSCIYVHVLYIYIIYVCVCTTIRSAAHSSIRPYYSCNTIIIARESFGRVKFSDTDLGRILKI